MKESLLNAVCFLLIGIVYFVAFFVLITMVWFVVSGAVIYFEYLNNLFL